MCHFRQYTCTQSVQILCVSHGFVIENVDISSLHSRCGHLDVVKYLVNDAHCDPNVKKEDGDTLLHLAYR